MRFGWLSFFDGLSRLILPAFFMVALPAFIAGAQPKTNPYSSIANRNVFGLKDPPPPVSFQPPPRPVPNLVLTGVADFSTAKWAFVTRTDPGRPSKRYTLTFHENEGGLQLIDMNVTSATATLLVDGIDTVTLRLAAATNHPAKPSPVGPFSGVRITRK